MLVMELLFIQNQSGVYIHGSKMLASSKSFRQRFHFLIELVPSSKKKKKSWFPVKGSKALFLSDSFFNEVSEEVTLRKAREQA